MLNHDWKLTKRTTNKTPVKAQNCDIQPLVLFSLFWCELSTVSQFCSMHTVCIVKTLATDTYIQRSKKTITHTHTPCVQLKLIGWGFPTHVVSRKMMTPKTTENTYQNRTDLITETYTLSKWVNVYNPSAPGNQHFRELLPRANDVINIYMTSNSTGNARFSCERSV